MALNRIVDNLRQDLRHAIRGLMKRPILLIMASLSIGLGVGANLAVYSLLRAVVFGGPTAPAADRLVRVAPEMSNPNYEDLRDSGAFAGLAAGQMTKLAWQSGSTTVMVPTHVVTVNFFDVFGTTAAVGRVFTAKDAGADGIARTVVLAYPFWQRYMGADPGVVGRTMTLNGWSYTVVGVLPQGFRSAAVLSNSVFLPFSAQVATGLTSREAEQLDVVGRLRDGVTPEQTLAKLRVTAERLERTYPEADRGFSRELRVFPARGIDQWREVPNGMRLLTFAGIVYAVVGLVLLIACTNVVGLLLARTTDRRHEIAVRIALGESRRRMVQGFLAEGFVFAFLGAATGLMLCLLLVGLLNRTALAVPIRVDVRPDLTLVLYMIGIVCAIASFCGAWPAMSAKHVAPGSLTSHHVDASVRRLGVRSVLVAAQVALSFVILAAGILLLRSFLVLHATQPGFDTAHTLTFRVRGGPTATPDPVPSEQSFRRRSDTVAALPGVVSVTCARYLPLALVSWNASIQKTDGTSQPFNADIHPVGPRYLETMQIGLLRGRDFVADDLRSNPALATPAIVNDTFARRQYGNDDPIDRLVTLVKRGGTGQDQRLRIVGVARDSKLHSLGEERHPVLYLPEATSQFLVRVDGSPALAVPMIQQAMLAANPGAAVEITTMQEQTATAVLPTQIATMLLGGLGGLGLLLAMIGVCGIVSHWVSRRTREIGIRMALGAPPRSVLSLVTREGLLLTAAGAVIGLLLSIGLLQVLRPFVATGLSPLDPITFVAVAIAVTAIGLAASLWPARRAARVEPMQALRYE